VGTASGVVIATLVDGIRPVGWETRN